MTKQDWGAISRNLAGKLSDEEAKILEMLIDGATVAGVSRILGQHRSMVWRKTQRIKKRAAS